MRCSLAGAFAEALSVTNVQDESNTQVITIKAKVYKPETFALVSPPTEVSFGPCLVGEAARTLVKVCVRNTTSRKRQFVVEGDIVHHIANRSRPPQQEDLSAALTELDEGGNVVTAAGAGTSQEKLEQYSFKLRIAERKGRDQKATKLLAKIEKIRHKLDGTADDQAGDDIDDMSMSESESDSDADGRLTMSAAAQRRLSINAPDRAKQNGLTFSLDADSVATITVSVMFAPGASFQDWDGKKTFRALALDVNATAATALATAPEAGITGEAEANTRPLSAPLPRAPSFRASATPATAAAGAPAGAGLNLVLPSTRKLSMQLANIITSDLEGMLSRGSTPELSDSHADVALRRPFFVTVAQYCTLEVDPEDAGDGIREMVAQGRLVARENPREAIKLAVSEASRAALSIHSALDMDIRVKVSWGVVQGMGTEDPGRVTYPPSTPSSPIFAPSGSPESSGERFGAVLVQAMEFAAYSDISTAARSVTEATFTISNSCDKMEAEPVKYVVMLVAKPAGNTLTVTEHQTGTLPPKGSQDVRLSLRAAVVGRWMHDIVVRNLANKHDQATVTVTATVKPAMYLHFPDLDPAALGKLQEIQIGNCYLPPVEPTRAPEDRGPLVEEALRPLSVRNVSSQHLYLTAIPNLRKQCFIYSRTRPGGELTQVVDLSLPAHADVTLYIELRPVLPLEAYVTGDIRELVGGIRFVGFSRSYAEKMREKEREKGEKGKDSGEGKDDSNAPEVAVVQVAEPDGGARADAETVVMELAADKLFELTVKFVGTAGVSIMRAAPTQSKFAVLKCSEGRGITTAYGQFQLENGSKALPLDYRLPMQRCIDGAFTEEGIDQALLSMLPGTAELLVVGTDTGTIPPNTKVALKYCILSKGKLGLIHSRIKADQSAASSGLTVGTEGGAPVPSLEIVVIANPVPVMTSSAESNAMGLVRCRVLLPLPDAPAVPMMATRTFTLSNSRSAPLLIFPYSDLPIRVELADAQGDDAAGAALSRTPAVPPIDVLAGHAREDAENSDQGADESGTEDAGMSPPAAGAGAAAGQVTARMLHLCGEGLLISPNTTVAVVLRFRKGAPTPLLPADQVSAGEALLFQGTLALAAVAAGTGAGRRWQRLSRSSTNIAAPRCLVFPEPAASWEKVTTSMCSTISSGAAEDGHAGAIAVSAPLAHRRHRRSHSSHHHGRQSLGGAAGALRVVALAAVKGAYCRSRVAVQGGAVVDMGKIGLTDSAGGARKPVVATLTLASHCQVLTPVVVLGLPPYLCVFPVPDVESELPPSQSHADAAGILWVPPKGELRIAVELTPPPPDVDSEEWRAGRHSIALTLQNLFSNDPEDLQALEVRFQVVRQLVRVSSLPSTGEAQEGERQAAAAATATAAAAAIVAAAAAATTAELKVPEAEARVALALPAISLPPDMARAERCEGVLSVQNVFDEPVSVLVAFEPAPELRGLIDIQLSLARQAPPAAAAGATPAAAAAGPSDVMLLSPEEVASLQVLLRETVAVTVALRPGTTMAVSARSLVMQALGGDATSLSIRNVDAAAELRYSCTVTVALAATHDTSRRQHSSAARALRNTGTALSAAAVLSTAAAAGTSREDGGGILCLMVTDVGSPGYPPIRVDLRPPPPSPLATAGAEGSSAAATTVVGAPSTELTQAERGVGADAAALSVLELRGCTPIAADATRYEINVGQQLVNPSSMEWETDVEWLTLGNSKGTLAAGKSQAVTLYLNRTRMGVFSTYMVMENARNPADLKFVRVEMEVVQQTHEGQQLARLFQVLVSPFTTGAAQQEQGLVMNFGDVYEGKLYNRRSFVILNSSAMPLEFQLSSSLSPSELNFSLSAVTLKQFKSVTIEANSKLQVFVHYAPVARQAARSTRQLSSAGWEEANASLPVQEVPVREHIYITCRLVKDFQQVVQLWARRRTPQLRTHVEGTGDAEGSATYGDATGILFVAKELKRDEDEPFAGMGGASAPTSSPGLPGSAYASSSSGGGSSGGGGGGSSSVSGSGVRFELQGGQTESLVTVTNNTGAAGIWDTSVVAGAAAGGPIKGVQVFSLLPGTSLRLRVTPNMEALSSGDGLSLLANDEHVEEHFMVYNNAYQFWTLEDNITSFLRAYHCMWAQLFQARPALASILGDIRAKSNPLQEPELSRVAAVLQEVSVLAEALEAVRIVQDDGSNFNITSPPATPGKHALPLRGNAVAPGGGGAVLEGVGPMVPIPLTTLPASVVAEELGEAAAQCARLSFEMLYLTDELLYYALKHEGYVGDFALKLANLLYSVFAAFAASPSPSEDAGTGSAAASVLSERERERQSKQAKGGGGHGEERGTENRKELPALLIRFAAHLDYFLSFFPYVKAGIKPLVDLRGAVLRN
ncbi:hypothetical protein JKP88DRAFT_350052 [Tribonema minus]|uniref:Uncharacterized protein n=1 Tax=Tribonema minus TaxID=303371 RepID=A0A835YYQ9_9STRA|nr:hypothetical protein JKP88DRAFT_350052 [Tribonema minus]